MSSDYTESIDPSTSEEMTLCFPSASSAAANQQSHQQGSGFTASGVKPFSLLIIGNPSVLICDGDSISSPQSLSYFPLHTSEETGTDLSQWLHTLGSSGLRAAAAEMKPNRPSPSSARGETPPGAIVLLTATCREEERRWGSGSELLRLWWWLTTQRRKTTSQRKTWWGLKNETWNWKQRIIWFHHRPRYKVHLLELRYFILSDFYCTAASTFMIEMFYTHDTFI